MKSDKVRLNIRLPKPLVCIVDILRVDAPRSDIIEYFLTWYIEQNIDRLLTTDAETRKIQALLSEVRR